MTWGERLSLASALLAIVAMFAASLRGFIALATLCGALAGFLAASLYRSMQGPKGGGW